MDRRMSQVKISTFGMHITGIRGKCLINWLFVNQLKHQHLMNTFVNMLVFDGGDHILLAKPKGQIDYNGNVTLTFKGHQSQSPFLSRIV